MMSTNIESSKDSLTMIASMAARVHMDQFCTIVMTSAIKLVMVAMCYTKDASSSTLLSQGVWLANSS